MGIFKGWRKLMFTFYAGRFFFKIPLFHILFLSLKKISFEFEETRIHKTNNQLTVFFLSIHMQLFFYIKMKALAVLNLFAVLALLSTTSSQACLHCVYFWPKICEHAEKSNLNFRTRITNFKIRTIF